MVSQWIVSEQTTNRIEEKLYDHADRSATRKRILKGTVRLELCWFSRYIRVWYWFHLLKLRNLLTQAFLSWIVILYGILLTEREASCVENSVESLIILLIARAIPWLYILWFCTCYPHTLILTNYTILLLSFKILYWQMLSFLGRNSVADFFLKTLYPFFWKYTWEPKIMYFASRRATFKLWSALFVILL